MASAYDLKSVKMPRITGTALKIFCSLMESPSTSGLLSPSLLRDAGIAAFRKLAPDSSPTYKPLYPPEAGGKLESEPLPPDSAAPPRSFHPAHINDYAKFYRSGRLTPVDLAGRFLRTANQSNSAEPPLRGMIAMQEDDLARQAEASALRWQKGQPLGPLDGVPIPVKDEIDQTPYPTTVGTRFLGKQPAAADATVVARLRQAGALLVGKANMHEIGIGVTGLNPNLGTARNPYNPAHFSGGSSSGPAVSVASGLAPAAIGADGGGSIRIPASFCGLVGLKATYGRVSETGAAPLCWSVAHIGPLASSAWDAAIVYQTIAGPDPFDPHTLNQPAVTLAGFNNFDLRDLKIGVFWPWFRHASPEVVSTCENMLTQMQKAGAKIVEIEISSLEALRVAHLVTIATEMATAMEPYYPAHHQDFGADVRTNLALAHHFTAIDYVLAQQQRTLAMAEFGRALQTVDVISVPSTGIASPEIPADALPDGESDLTTLAEIMRFAVAANFTGLPAISFPAGFTAQGMPVGFQAIGRPWNEHTLLRLAHFAETVVEPKKPALYWDLLAD